MAAAHRPYLTFTLFALLCAVFAIELTSASRRQKNR